MAAGTPAAREGIEALAKMVCLFAPFTAEEMWSRLGNAASVHQQPWPSFDPAIAAEDSVTCVVQINGKVRDRLEVSPGIDADALQALALASDVILKAMGAMTIRQVISRPPKLVNIVAG